MDLSDLRKLWALLPAQYPEKKATAGIFSTSILSLSPPAFSTWEANALWPKYYWRGRLESPGEQKEDFCGQLFFGLGQALQLPLEKAEAPSAIHRGKWFGALPFDYKYRGLAEKNSFTLPLLLWDFPRGPAAPGKLIFHWPSTLSRKSLDKIFENLLSPPAQKPSTDLTSPTPNNWISTPSKEKWAEKFSKTLESFRSAHPPLKKIVLGRKKVGFFKKKIEALLLLRKLTELTQAGSTYCYGFLESPHRGIIGISPEKLFSLKDQNQIQTEALAGTRPRGQSKKEDQVLGQELLTSKKERREHQMVVDFLTKTLEDLKLKNGPSTQKATPKLFYLPTLQHLKTTFPATPISPQKISKLISLFHPTPAMAGTPPAQALKTLRDLENGEEDREFFCGPIGYFGEGSAEFAPLIRSAVIKDHTLTTFGGAGILPESQSLNEWEEIENKMNSFLNLLYPVSPGLGP